MPVSRATGVLAGLAALLMHSSAAAAVFINEFHYDNSGADSNERVEVIAPAGTDLSGWSIELYNGSGGASYATLALSGVTSDQCGGHGVVSVAASGMQNGAPDGLALVNAAGQAVQFLSYEGTLTASSGAASGMGSSDVGVNETSGTPVGQSLQLAGTGSEAADFSWQSPAASSFGSCNAGQTMSGGGGGGGGGEDPPPAADDVLVNGVAKTGLTATSGNSLAFHIDVPAGATDLSFAMSGGSGDADLYVKFGSAPTSSSYDCRPYKNGNNETCNFATPQAGTWYVMLDAYSTFSGLSLTASYTEGGNPPPPPAGSELSKGVAVTGLAATSGNALNYTMDVPAGASNLSFSSSGGSGDADLYVKFGSAPSDSSYDCRPYQSGNAETCTFSAPQAGTYYVRLKAYSSFSGVSLVGDYTSTASNAAPVAGFTHSSSALAVTFSDTSTDSDGTLASHAWDFGDGGTSTAASPSHTYSVAGSYTVSLTVTDNDGASDTATASVTVSSGGGGGDPGPYYDGVVTTSASALRTSLHEIIDDHTRFPYSSSATDTWTILEFADEDPLDPNRILDIYKNESYVKAGGGNTNYNREHTWPKSLGFPDDVVSNYPYTDTHMLMLSNSSYNSSRSNKPFGNCDASCAEYPTTAYAGQGGGSGVFPGNSNWSDGTIWQVWVKLKGDVARAMFYMDVRYEGGTHGVTGAAEPDLRLTDDISLIGPSSGNASVAYMGLLSVLLQWSAEDPPTAAEVLRNDAIQSYQGNRNPFVDHPEWVACIYQGVCN